MYIKSPMNYTGGKYKILGDIVNCFPEQIDTFVDLFAGGFNVGINVDANKIICNDHINYIVDWYKFLRITDTNLVLKRIDDVIKEFELSKTNVDGYLSLRERYNISKDLIDFFVLTCFSFNHQIRFNNSHQFNTPFGKNRSSFNPKIKENLILFSNALKNKNIEFHNDDFSKIDLDNFKEHDLIYCDPPYLISTGSYNDGKRGFKDWSSKEEKQLLDLLDSLSKRNIKFALSNVLYHKGLTNDILVDWSKMYNIHYINKSYANCNYQFKEKDCKTVEVLITNF